MAQAKGMSSKVQPMNISPAMYKDNLRMPGSIGAGGVQRVFKGMRMAGRMGGENVKVQNLRVLKVMADKNLLLVKGCVPGHINSYVIIQK